MSDAGTITIKDLLTAWAEVAAFLRADLETMSADKDFFENACNGLRDELDKAEIENDRLRERIDELTPTEDEA